MFDSNENPYQSPPYSGKGEYDWTLAKHVLSVVAALAFFYMALVAIPLWKEFRSLPIHQNKTIWKAVIEFGSDWRSANQHD